MNTLTDWIPLFGGAAIGLLVIVLIASARGSKAKRRDVKKTGETLAGMTIVTPLDTPSPVSAAHATERADLIERNRELAREIAALASKLQTSQTNVERLQGRLNSLEIQNSEIGKIDGRHQADLDQLRARLPPDDGLFEDAERLRQQAETENFQLKAEIASLAERSEAEGEIESLKTEGAPDDITAELDATQGQLDEMTRRHEELQNDNSRLRKEIAGLKRRLAARADDTQRLKTARQSLHELQVKHDTLTNSARELQKDFTRLSELLAPEPEPSWQLGAPAEIDGARPAFEKETKSTESTQPFQPGTADQTQHGQIPRSKPES